MSAITDWLTAVATALAAGAAYGSYKASTHANETASSLARIEADRRHIERTPQIELRYKPTSEPDADLYIDLNGPDELGALDSIHMAVEDDDREVVGENFVQHVGGPSKEQLLNFVWGPFRFAEGADGVDKEGRTVAPFPLTVGKGRRLVMQRTRPGFWMTSMTCEQWQKQNENNQIRLRITCRLGEEEWVLTRRLDNPPYPPGLEF